MEKPTLPSSDERLSELLQTWHVEVPEDPWLHTKVWRRIRAEEAPGVRGWWRRLAAVVPRPAVMVACALAFAVGGGLLAQLQSTMQRHQQLDRLAREYVLSIDPVQMIEPTSHSDKS